MELYNGVGRKEYSSNALKEALSHILEIKILWKELLLTSLAGRHHRNPHNRFRVKRTPEQMIGNVKQQQSFKRYRIPIVAQENKSVGNHPLIRVTKRTIHCFEF